MTEKQSPRENVLKPISSNILFQSDMSSQEQSKVSESQPDYFGKNASKSFEDSIAFTCSKPNNLKNENTKTNDFSVTEKIAGKQVHCIQSGDSRRKASQSHNAAFALKESRTNYNSTHSSGDGRNRSQSTARQNSTSFEDDEGFEDDCTAVEQESVGNFDALDAATLESLLPSDILPALSDPGHSKEDDGSDGGSEILELLHKSLTNFNEEVRAAEHAIKPKSFDLIAEMKSLQILNEKCPPIIASNYHSNKNKVSEYSANHSPIILTDQHSKQDGQNNLNVRKNERLDSGTFCETLKFCESLDAKSKSHNIAKRNTFSANSSPKHHSFYSAMSDSCLDRGFAERPLSLYSINMQPAHVSFNQHLTFSDAPPGYTTRPILKLVSSSPPADLSPANKLINKDKTTFQLKEYPVIGSEMKNQTLKPVEFQVNNLQKRTRYKVPKEVHALPPLLQIAAKSREIESHLDSNYAPLEHKKLTIGNGSYLPYPEKCKRACSFYLRGHCKKEDCEFAHDLTKVTCKFWQMGECFKGSTCPFLHGYLPENITI